MFGDDYVSDVPRRYDRKVKNAQEAHEAIRPPASRFAPRRGALPTRGDELAVYDLVWKRTLASQWSMPLTQDKVRLESTLSDLVGFDADVLVGLSATGLRHRIPWFSTGLRRGTDDPRPNWPTRSASCRRSPKARSCPSRAPKRRATTPSRPTATPKRR